jgi:hypothetical protein
MFRRRRAESQASDAEDPVNPGRDDDAQAALPASPPEEPPTGPHDAVAPDDGVPRIDLGALLVPMVEGHELRFQVVADSGAVQAVVVAGPRAELELAAFAAPRTEGIWAEVRGEIAAELATAGGVAREVEGPSGSEVVAQIPVPGEQPGTTRLLPARFLGADGPRWFLRGVLTGAAVSPETPESEYLRRVFAAVVVVRGDEAKTVREQLPLRFPREVAEQIAAAAATAEPAPAAGDFGPFERGPEITETR